VALLSPAVLGSVVGLGASAGLGSAAGQPRPLGLFSSRIGRTLQPGAGLFEEVGAGAALMLATRETFMEG